MELSKVGYEEGLGDQQDKGECRNVFQESVLPQPKHHRSEANHWTTLFKSKTVTISKINPL